MIERGTKKEAHGQNHRPRGGRGQGPVRRERVHPPGKERKGKKGGYYRGRRIRK